MEYLTPDAFLNENPEPIGEDFEVPGLGGFVHIQGVSDYDARVAIDKDAAHFYNDKGEPATLRHPKTGKMFTPIPEHIQAAAWAAACVTQPALNSTAWLFFAATNAAALISIWRRCLICSRLMEDPEDNLADGLVAAKAGIEKSEDPLVSGGSSTA